MTNYHKLQGREMYQSLLTADLDRELQKIACSEEVNYNNRNGKGALIMAVYFGKSNVVKFLLDAGVEVKKDDNQLMFFASSGKSLEIVKMLEKEGVDPCHIGKNGVTTLMMASHSPNDEVFDYFLNAGVDPLHVSKSKKTALHFVALHGSLRKFEVLIKKGCDVFALDENGKSILHFAAENGNAEIFFTAVKMGLDISIKSKLGDTLLHSAAYGANEEIFNFLLDKKMDCFAINNEGFTLLHKSLSGIKTSVNITSKLLDMGLDPLSKTIYGEHALHFASGKIDKKTIHLLIQMGCNLHDKDEFGLNCFDHAIDNEILKFLKEHDLNKPGNYFLSKIKKLIDSPKER